MELDITREHCPMTFVKVKLALANLDSGSIVSVLLSSGEPLENVPRSAEEQGHKILSIEEVDHFYRVVIQKK